VKKAIILVSALLVVKLAVARSWAGDIRADIKTVKNQYPFLSYIPEGLVVAIAKVESDHVRTAKGAAGEYGLMQVMPGTWNWVFNRYGLGVPLDPYDAFTNILGGMLYLDTAYQRLGDWFSVIHAYNRGIDGFLLGRRNWPYFLDVAKWWAAA